MWAKVDACLMTRKLAGWSWCLFLQYIFINFNNFRPNDVLLSEGVSETLFFVITNDNNDINFILPVKRCETYIKCYVFTSREYLVTNLQVKTKTIFWLKYILVFLLLFNGYFMHMVTLYLMLIPKKTISFHSNLM